MKSFLGKALVLFIFLWGVISLFLYLGSAQNESEQLLKKEVISIEYIYSAGDTWLVYCYVFPRTDLDSQEYIEKFEVNQSIAGNLETFNSYSVMIEEDLKSGNKKILEIFSKIVFEWEREY